MPIHSCNAHFGLGGILRLLKMLVVLQMVLPHLRPPWKLSACEKYLKIWEGYLILLSQMMKQCASQLQIQMTHYDQSSKCTKPSDSSVSYVAAVVRQV